MLLLIYYNFEWEQWALVCHANIFDWNLWIY